VTAKAESSLKAALCWTLTDRVGGFSVSEECSFVPLDLAVWGWKRVISPEVFYGFSIGKGERTVWERIWRFRAR
jgi:hypothetical protein